MVKYRKPKNENIELLNNCLICSLLALSDSNILLKVQTNHLSTNNKILHTITKSQQVDFLLIYLSNIHSKVSLYEIISQLIQTVNTTFKLHSDYLKSSCYENELLKQYLRKFNFFYKYYYINNYPNELSMASIKKINMLAIKSLFLLYSI